MRGIAMGSIVPVAVLFLLLGLPLAAGGGKEPGKGTGENTGGKKVLDLFVSILPQSYLVERIGGPGVRVSVLVKPGESPHSYEPTPKQVAALGRADAYFTTGYPFEKRVVEKIVAAGTRLVLLPVDTGIVRRPVDEPLIRAGKQSAAAQGDHGHEEGSLDPHIWLSPGGLKIQAENIYSGLFKIDPANMTKYRRNLDLFLSDLSRLDERIERLLKPYRGRSIFVFHPSFGYFTDSYGLKQVPIEIEGKSPTPRQLERLVNAAKEQGVRIIFVQPQFDRKSAETVAKAIGGAVVAIDPMSANVLATLEDMASKVEETFR